LLENIGQDVTGFAQFFNMAAGSHKPVTIEADLRGPAVSYVITILSRTLAAIPMDLCQKGDGGRETVDGYPAGSLSNHAANDEIKAYDFRLGRRRLAATGSPCPMTSLGRGKDNTGEMVRDHFGFRVTSICEFAA
jgi:hypothetical protein